MMGRLKHRLFIGSIDIAFRVFFLFLIVPWLVIFGVSHLFILGFIVGGMFI